MCSDPQTLPRPMSQNKILSAKYSKCSHCGLLFLPFVSLFIFLTGCIKNDIPYPKIQQDILEIVAEGQLKEAYIDPISSTVTIYLEETTDIENVRFTKYEISPDGVSDPNLLEGTYNLSTPIFVTLSRFQDYVWEIKAEQDIERYFEIEGQMGQSLIDPVAHRVVVKILRGTDLSNLNLLSVCLGPPSITTLTPDLKPGRIDLSEPLRVAVECFGRVVFWEIHAELEDAIVVTSTVDAWSKVIWAYGEGPADVANGFQYRAADSDEWIDVPQERVVQDQGNFYASIPHLEPLTEYVVRAVSGENIAQEVKVTTQATADLPNGDFEEWSQVTKGRSQMWCPWAEGETPFWDTGNTGSITLGTNLTAPTDQTVTGSGRAAQLSTKFVGIGTMGKLGAGSLYSGSWQKLDGMNGVLDFGRPWNLRPTKLRGFYKYNGVDIDYAGGEFSGLLNRPDTCVIYIALTDWTAPFEVRTNPANRQLFDKNASYVIGYGELQRAGSMASYEPFEIEIKYKSTSIIPSYIMIVSTSSKYGDYFTGGNGSTLLIDQYSLDYDL